MVDLSLQECMNCIECASPLTPESNLPLGGKDILRALGVLVVQQV